jgi:hypothetical protein
MLHAVGQRRWRRDFLRHTFEATSCGLHAAAARDEPANAVAANKSDQQQHPAATAIAFVAAASMASLSFPADAYFDAQLACNVRPL